MSRFILLKPTGLHFVNAVNGIIALSL